MKFDSLTLEETKRILNKVCEAIAYAHTREKPITHCDLKPSNILFNDTDEVLVSDFGLSKIIEDTTHISLTNREGSEGYMAPEQRNRKVRLQSDTFALGVILHEMLTGKLPQEEFTKGILKIFPEEPLPTPIKSVIEKATLADHENRYYPATELARAFNEALKQIYAEFSTTQEKIVSQDKIDYFAELEYLILQDNLGHEKSVNDVVFSPDGRLLASASEDSTIRLWDIHRREELHPLKSYRAVRSVAFSPDGKILASGGEDGTIRLWQITNGQEIQNLKWHEDKPNNKKNLITKLIFSPNGQFLVSENDDGTIGIWEIQRGQELRQWKRKRKGGIAFNPKENILISGEYDGTICFWDINRGERLNQLKNQIGSVTNVVVNPDGRLLASTSITKIVQLWDIENQILFHTLGSHESNVLAIAFSSDGCTLASGCEDGTIILWNTANGQRIKNLSGHTEAVLSLCFHPNKLWLASASSDTTVRLWPLE